MYGEKHEYARSPHWQEWFIQAWTELCKELNKYDLSSVGIIPIEENYTTKENLAYGKNND